ncbi:hypothetical protein FJY63_09450, partial [Candidatus Sumerlaeota bacterium]|nr:hypothetical protein [Candidatus Sumerlaeota bacterium]
MIDPVLERHYSDCRELMNLWREYHDFFKMAVSGEGVTPEKEGRFITLKSRIAMLHDSFMDCLEHDQNIGQNVLAIVTRSITLKHVARMSPAEIKKIELEWHESYLLLNETLGGLDDRRKRFAQVSPAQYYRQVYSKKTIEAMHRFVTGWAFKGIVGAVVVIAGFVAFLQFGGWAFLLRTPATRKLVMSVEDVFRIAYKEYPYRQATQLHRLDATHPHDIKPLTLEKARQVGAKDGIRRIGQKMGTGANDVTADLEKHEDFRCDLWQLGGAFASGDMRVFLYRLKTVSDARQVETKYRSFLAAAPASQSQDWVLFRSANIIGAAFD